MNRQQRRAAERQSISQHRDLSRFTVNGDKGTRVVIGYLHTDELAAEFCASLTGLLQHDARSSRYICGPGGGIIDIRSGPRVAEGRTQLVEHYLVTEMYQQAEWMLMLDSDMAFDADLLDRLMAVAHPTERPIIGGLAFAGRHYGPQWPTIYEMYQAGESFGVRPVTDYPEDALVKCGATGAACLLVHRQVYNGMAAAAAKVNHGEPVAYPWFVEGLVAPDGAPLGEDIAFCRRAQVLGIPVHVHTGAKLGHMKMSPLTEATFRGQMAEENDRLAQAMVEAVQA